MPFEEFPALWGVINLTPDSFYAGSRATVAEALQRCEAMFRDGAAMVDVGAESTRPGAKAVPAGAQVRILTEFLEGFRRQFGSEKLLRLSIDTRELEVMRRVCDFGVGAINDVSGGSPEVFAYIATSGVQYVLVHTQGTPETMQDNPRYDDVCAEVFFYLQQKTAQLIAAGVRSEKIIWDTGIGFGKSVEHNLQLLARQHEFRKAGYRLLAGVSRKSFIGKLLNQPDPKDRLIGTLATQLYLALRGLEILRVHDVREMADALRILDAIKKYEL